MLFLLAGCGGPRSAPPSARRESTSPSSLPANSTSASDSTSPTRAAAWVQDYYRAINEHRYRDAYAHWEQDGLASRKSFEEFEKGFDQTGRVEVRVGAPGPIGAAAGSRYVEVPVRIVARAHDGSEQIYSGSYTLRLSVVDGATPEQRAWHIYSAHMQRLNTP